MKWKAAVLESFDSWTRNFLNWSFVDRFESDLSNENDAEKNALWMRMKFRNWNKRTDVEIEANNIETMKKINTIVETNEKTTKENWMLCV